MKALVQRFRGDLSIEIESITTRVKKSFSGVGLVVLLGWMQEDLNKGNFDASEDWILSRILGLRVFEDENGKMNLSLAEYAQSHQMKSGILWVSQFTLAGELESGFRPSFTKAMSPSIAKGRFERLGETIQKMDSSHTHLFGEFGASMQISFTNWGPVTLMLEKT